MTKRVLIFIYGVACYVLFLFTFVYAAGFVGDFLAPKTVDSGRTGSLTGAFLVDLGLLGMFAVQHSAMARPAFKQVWIRIVPESAERSSYVLFSSLALIALFYFWQPIGGVVWHIEDSAERGIVYALFGFGWLLVLISTFLINHFDLFGLRQVWLQLSGRPYSPLPFRTPLLYRYARHPLYLGWLFAFWATPTMTAAHLLFAIMTTAYIMAAIQLEERDLVAVHGRVYSDYQRSVPMILPIPSRKSAPERAMKRAI